MAKVRLGYLDIAKAIAIAFVIIGHTGIVFNADVVAGGMPQWLVHLAFSLHLPVFFIVSGYFFKPETPLSWGLVRKDAKGLLLPYAVTCALIVLFCTLSAFADPARSGRAEFIRWFGASLFGAGAVSPVAVFETERIGGIWFLLAMFWGHLLIAATRRLPDWSRFLVMVGALILAVRSAQYVWLPLSVQSGLGCAIWLYTGCLIRKHGLFDKGRVPLPAWLAILGVWGVVIALDGNLSLAMVDYPHGVLDYFGGVAACFCIVRGSAFIEAHTRHGSPWLQAIGRNTLAVFTMHILEDNVLPWGVYSVALSEAWGGFPLTWVALQAIRFAVDGVLVLAAYVAPGIRQVYFPQLRGRKASSLPPRGAERA